MSCSEDPDTALLRRRETRAMWAVRESKSRDRSIMMASCNSTQSFPADEALKGLKDISNNFHSIISRRGCVVMLTSLAKKESE
eukprot:3695866-Rhodomonas_salina.1